MKCQKNGTGFLLEILERQSRLTFFSSISFDHTKTEVSEENIGIKTFEQCAISISARKFINSSLLSKLNFEKLS